MGENDQRVSRRRFLLAGSAAIATPLLLNAASHAAAGSAETKTSGTDIPKGTKVYFIGNGCIGCQVCRTFCPAKAINFGNRRNEIDQAKCKHCGTCYKGCHISAISETILS